MIKIFFLAYLLLVISVVCDSQPIRIQTEKDGVWMMDGKQKVFFYQKTPKSLDGKYSRSNYLHPVFGLDGEILTEDFPVDHFHHRGIFWTWHQLWIDTLRISDPWMCENFSQDVTAVNFHKGKQSTGILELNVLWKSPLWLKNGIQQAVISENTRITVFPARDDYRRIDFRITLNALENGIRLGGSEDEKGYSGFSVRMPLVSGMKFTSGNTEVMPQNTALTAGPEMDISGRIGAGGKMAGIMIICHRSNPGFPQKWIIRKEKSMQNCAWPGNTTVSLKKSEPLVLNYTVIIHRNDATLPALPAILQSILAN